MAVSEPAARVVIAGSGGRMGETLLEAVFAAEDLALAAALEVPASELIGHDAGERFGRATGVVVAADVSAALETADVLIDFTRPAGTLAHVAACAKAGVGAVVGTTGLSEADRRALAEAARSVPIVFASNMSVGVTVLTKLVEIAAQRLGEGYDVEILEMHHRHKIDAPSGTALTLGEAVATALHRNLESDAVYARRGVTGERKPKAIGFASLRGGDVVGDHTVVFAGPGERVELTHRASSRMTFAQGALRAVRFVAAKRAQRAAGLYDMQDVLGLR
ncbi:MAG TPA: 4-hydroxy-tetrahydrodipicolinate reductase [Casimicrobiaceae bacterium]|nr:4-hydroxy-tetrahydrodipicolinate reductase [Casimicrobiaceae bacterium]